MSQSASLIALDHVAVSQLGELGDQYQPQGAPFDPFECALERTWQHLHVVLTGEEGPSQHPLAIFDGLGNQSAPDHHWSALTPAQMKAFHCALDAENDAALSRRLNTEWMEKHGLRHPHGEGLNEHAWSHATQHLSDLRRFAAACTKHQCGALVVMT